MGQTWCMPASPNACSGGTTTTTTATTATTKTTTSSTTTTGGSGGSSCQLWWIGDGFCDPENNKAECLFDRGDCCPPYAHPHWDYWCKRTNQCVCKKRSYNYNHYHDLAHF